MNSLLALSILGLLLVSVGFGAAYASLIKVIIPTGAADEHAPFFFDKADLNVRPGDQVEWANGDTTAHTVTSGNPTDGPDGTFDSGLFGPGKTFSYSFTTNDSGIVSYYCMIHPWMVGTVTVESSEQGYKIIQNVGADAGDGLTTFDVEYTLDKVLADAKVDEAEKSITFTMAGVGKDGDEFVVKLPKNLVGGNLLVWVDGQPITDYGQEEEGGINKITIPLTAKSEQVTIVGTTVVPEFGPLVAVIFVITAVTIIISAKTSLISKI